MNNLSKYFKGVYGTVYYVQDMARAVRLYKKTLGFKARYESRVWTEFDHDGVALCLHKADEEQRGGGGMLIYSVEGLAALVEGLKESGVKLTGEPREVHGGIYMVEMEDGEGNWVGLYGRL